MKKFLSLILVMILLLSVLTACKKGEGPSKKEPELEEILSKIKEEMGDDYLPEERVELDMISNITSITPADVDEFIGEWPMMTMNIDRFIGIKAKEDRADKVEEGLEEYKRYMIEDEFKYPMNMPKVNASKLVRHGDYVFYLVLGANDDNMGDAEGKDALDFAENEVNKVVEIIDGFFK